MKKPRPSSGASPTVGPALKGSNAKDGEYEALYALFPQELTGSSSAPDTDTDLALYTIVYPNWWWWKELVKDMSIDVPRLQRILNYACDPTYSIREVPLATTWGEGGLDVYMTTPSGLVCNILVCGVIQAMSWNASYDLPVDRSRISLALFREADKDAVARLRNLSSPKPVNDVRSFTAFPDRFLGSAGSIFGDVYDATTTFGRKDAMKKLSVSDLRLGDVVIAEVFCMRKRETTFVTPQWSEWSTHFTLRSLSRVFAVLPTPKRDFFDVFYETL